jgi:predicted small integral membrane protein
MPGQRALRLKTRRVKTRGPFGQAWSGRIRFGTKVPDQPRPPGGLGFRFHLSLGFGAFFKMAWLGLVGAFFKIVVWGYLK